MDFGNHFKVKAEAFRMQPRDGLPVRMAEAVVYGSNDRKHWTLLTENKAVSSPDLQTLTVKEEERNKPYRYLRFFMPAKPFPIFEIAEFRIVGERIEDLQPGLSRGLHQGLSGRHFPPRTEMTKAEAASCWPGWWTTIPIKAPMNALMSMCRGCAYFDDVAYMSSKGFITADSENRFRPQDAITRGEFADFVARMNKLGGKTQTHFPDVTDETPHAAAIRSVAEKGWLNGQADGTFRPNVPMTRVEVVVALDKMLQRHCATPPARAQEFKDVTSPTGPMMRSGKPAPHMRFNQKYSSHERGTAT